MAVLALGQSSLLCVAHTRRPAFASVSSELNTAFATSPQYKRRLRHEKGAPQNSK